jgi:hypothetical protein
VKKVTNPSADGGVSPAQGEWVTWVDHDEVGVGDYSDRPIGDDIEIDDDGVVLDVYRCVIDLSHAMSKKLGRQCPMTAIYRLKDLKIGLRNVDDGSDNDAATVFSGKIRWVAPNKHAIDAIQAARKLARNKSSVQLTGSGMPTAFGQAGAGERPYTGFRFGWRTENDVMSPTPEDFPVGSAVDGGTPSWCLYDDDGALSIIDGWSEYNGMNATKSNALWTKRTGATSQKLFTCVNNATDGNAPIPANTDYHYNGGDNHLAVVGGLLCVDFMYSSTDQVGANDDLTVHIEVGVEGWEEF